MILQSPIYLCNMRFNVLFFCLFLVFCSCFDPKAEKKKYDCMLSQEECNLVIESPPKNNSVWFEVKGYDPISHKKKVCKTSNRWWNLFADEMDYGDTIVKKRGELIFAIHKRDTIIYHNWHTVTSKL